MRPRLEILDAALVDRIVDEALAVLETEAMREAGLAEVAICVGGAPISQAFADEIGADGYAAEAGGAVELFERLAASRARTKAGSGAP